MDGTGIMKILFICTHNRCRSIIAEAIANHVGGGLITAASAGSEPAGQVHPMALASLEEAGIEVAGLTSKSWNDMAAFAPDLVVTVCDNAANEVCPVWFGRTEKAHWGLKDPSVVQGSAEEVRDAFRALVATLRARLDKLRELLATGCEDRAVFEAARSLGREDVGV